MHNYYFASYNTAFPDGAFVDIYIGRWGINRNINLKYIFQVFCIVSLTKALLLGTLYPDYGTKFESCQDRTAKNSYIK